MQLEAQSTPDDGAADYWQHVRPQLAELLNSLNPQDALSIVRALIAEENPNLLAPLLAGSLMGHSARRRDDVQRRV